MKRQVTPNVDQLSRYRGQIDADDGHDPREFFKKESQPRSAGRKTQQLCRQVAETLDQVFAESAEVSVQSLRVVSAQPAPDASQLLVLVAPAVGAQISEHEAVAALSRASGWLRSQVAAAITRKRAPQLIFRCVFEPGEEAPQ